MTEKLPIAKCKGCGADIIWIKYNGKAHPVDARPKKGFTVTADLIDGVHGKYAEIHESHFATCSKSVHFRKEPANVDTARS